VRRPRARPLERLRYAQTSPARTHFSTSRYFPQLDARACLSECVGVGRVHCLCMPSADPGAKPGPSVLLRGDPTPSQTSATAARHVSVLTFVHPERGSER
jgi:hypothetical protein